MGKIQNAITETTQSLYKARAIGLARAAAKETVGKTVEDIGQGVQKGFGKVRELEASRDPKNLHPDTKDPSISKENIMIERINQFSGSAIARNQSKQSKAFDKAVDRYYDRLAELDKNPNLTDAQRWQMSRKESKEVNKAITGLIEGSKKRVTDKLLPEETVKELRRGGR